jgi:hypothetical protein
VVEVLLLVLDVASDLVVLDVLDEEVLSLDFAASAVLFSADFSVFVLVERLSVR